MIYKILTILAFTIWIQYLAISGGLAFYIHPRYIDFSNIMSYFAMGFTIISLIVFVLYRSDIHHHVHFTHNSKADKNVVAKLFSKILNFQYTNLLLIIVLILGFSLPVRGLSSATASVRGVGNNLVVSNAPTENVNPFLRPASESLDISDWLKQFVLESDVNVFKSRKVSISGFVFLNADILNLSKDNFQYFKLSRFVITCCAVDARPVGIYVKYDKKFAEQVKSDKWLKVGGVFEIENISGVETPVVEVKTVEEIPTPQNPYLY